MKHRSARELRSLYLDYFQKLGHEVVKSSSLVPANDPTLMFTTAGMVQFKDVFRGVESRPYSRAVVSQKCLRVSGKQNDLEEVGRTARHHTFFEMLGNFSLGDYFRREAIEFAWTFLTEVLELPTDRLWITVFKGEGDLKADDEARAMWREVTGFSDDRIIGLGMEDNFWAMGDTGPCGVTSEIFFDIDPGKPVTLDDFENGRIVEIWNLVFMSYDRQEDGTLNLLPKPSIDTGMGLERLACVIQNEKSNFHTDLFMPLIERVSSMIGKPYQRSDSEDDVSMRVLSDHARTVAFLVTEGIRPSNEGRGYVMRRIMRRAIRHGKRLGFDTLFLSQICDTVVELMGDAYPELHDARALIQKVAELEEDTFRRTLDRGLGLLEEEIKRSKASGTLSGETVFKLYDTFGFPKDLTEVIAAERGLEIDEAGFEREMAAQQERSRGSAIGEAATATVYKTLRESHGPVTFVGYPEETTSFDEREGEWRFEELDGNRLIETQTKISAVIQDGNQVETATDGIVEVLLDPTPFFGESGGQQGDRGVIRGENGVQLDVIDTQRPVDGLTLARARVTSGEVKNGATVWAGYGVETRKITRAHHSATHLLHASLRDVLGAHVKQAGSFVGPEYLRFDYTHFEAPTAEQLKSIEEDSNARTSADDIVVTEEMPIDDAKETGAIALFGETYGDMVRVVRMGESVELCGGTHSARTGDIGMVLVMREEAIASGVRRLEAKVGPAAIVAVEDMVDRLGVAAKLLQGDVADPGEDLVLKAIQKAVADVSALETALADAGQNVEAARPKLTAPVAPKEWSLAEGRRIRDLWQGLRRFDASADADLLETVDREGLIAGHASVLSRKRELDKLLNKARSSKLFSQVDDLLENTKMIGDVPLLTARVDGVEGKALRSLTDKLRDQMPTGVMVLMSVNDDKTLMVANVSKDLQSKASAGDIIKKFAPLIGGKGGGNAQFAQAGGDKPDGIEDVFANVENMLGR
ncbi:MAG: alanine--tRNA ligase [Sulfitobacter sp.]